MNTNKRIVIAFLFMLSASSDSMAQTVYGFGIKSCGTLLTEFNNAQSGDLTDKGIYMADEAWVQGYLTAKSEAGNEEETDHNGSMQWILNYCQTRPLDKLWVASYALVKELKKKK